MEELGRLMAEAHASYRDDFEGSVKEADLLVELANKLPGLIGARLTGGGFGGCTVNLVEKNHAAEFASKLKEEYRSESGIEADIYLCHASAAAHALYSSQLRDGKLLCNCLMQSTGITKLFGGDPQKCLPPKWHLFSIGDESRPLVKCVLLPVRKSPYRRAMIFSIRFDRIVDVQDDAGMSHCVRVILRRPVHEVG